MAVFYVFVCVRCGAQRAGQDTGAGANASTAAAAAAAWASSSMPAVRAALLSEQETAAWLLDLSGTCPLSDLAARGIPTRLDK